MNARDHLKIQALDLMLTYKSTGWKKLSASVKQKMLQSLLKIQRELSAPATTAESQ